MARSRNIKPGFYKNEDLAECSIFARYIFPGLWMLADREGRLEDRPKRIKGELLPFDPEDVDPLLDELQRHGFILRYRNEDGRFIQILKFLDHQAPHYSEKPSVIKPPTLPESGGDDGSPNPRGLPENSRKNPAIKRQTQLPDSLIPDSLIPESTPLAPSDPEKPDRPAPKVVLNGSGFTIPAEIAASWRKAYPAVDVDAEVAKAYAWALANPKNRKENWARFLVNWLGKAQERAPAVKPSTDWRDDPRFRGMI